MVRPETEALKDCAYLCDKGFEALAFPILTRDIYPSISSPPNHQFQAVIYTSKQAIHAAHLGASKTAFCVGSGTADAAKKIGFETVFQGPSDGAALAELIVKKTKPEEGGFYWPHGRDIRFDMAEALVAHGFMVSEQTVYEMHPITHLSEAQKSSIEQATGPVCFAVMSLHHLSHLEKLLEQAQIWHDETKWHLMVLTDEMARYAGPRWHTILASQKANREAMLTLIMDHMSQLETRNSPD